jgi:hypothetical protein
MNFIAKNKDVLFSGNTAYDVSNAIHNDNGTINFNAGNNSVIINDGITGSNGTININQSGIDISENKDEITATLTTGISINHLISILAAFVGGFVWKKFGFGVLFSFAAVMALANSAFAMTIKVPKK